MVDAPETSCVVSHPSPALRVLFFLCVARYTVYLSLNGFTQNVLTSTACGLAGAPGVITYTTSDAFRLIDGLDVSSEYEVRLVLLV